ncbi:MAG: CRISPR-associated helicase Cas3' [Chloroflexi bacterium]|nr:CRISPR-associated helicase Cas3' [Chloroflexota bacterium]
MSRNYDSPTYHPLLCHMIDVSMVAREMWTSALSPGQRSEAAITLGFGSDDEAAGRWFALFAGLHDLGKASPSFQLQVGRVRSKVAERLYSVGLRWGQIPINPPLHGTITAATLPNILENEFGLNAQGSKRIAVVVGGHHGVLPRTSDINNVRSTALGTREWDVLRRDIVKWLAEVLDVPRDRIPGDISNATAMALAGFVSIADWIGSNTDYFDYACPSDLSAYARGAADIARQALDDLGWVHQPRPRGVQEFKKLFPHIAVPNELQRTVALCVREIDAPGLVIIESPMGEGKTEASMYLADYWAESAGRHGCYFALPTQATSNQMFGRVRDFLYGQYTGDQVQLQLLHGHASLSAEFQVLRRNHRTFTPTGIDQDANARDTNDAGVIAAEWFTHRKRGLLAPFGVGTIDQVLLAALQTKHVFVRLFGLAWKTVIVDEVHAYDAYMLTLLERLLEWLAALGSPVVLLSATLPRNRREALLAAYLKGLGNEAGPETAALQTTYPRISWASASSPRGAQTVQASRGAKTIALEWTDGALPDHDVASFPLGERLKRALAQGGCAAVICNTVRRAQDIYLALKPYFPNIADDGCPELDLLHARYLFEDREAREQRALARFGKPDGTVTDATGKERAVQRPSSAVLVSTQVIEQSLDLDFDLMVSDMAPADLLLQRTGRLHRHQRSRSHGVEHPRLLVCRPEPSDGVPQFEAGTKAVYDQHVLLRSWLALRDRQTIRVPDDVEEMIENVYDDRSPVDLSERLREEWQDTRNDLEEAIEKEREEARNRWIKAPAYSGQLWRLAADPHEEDSPDFHQAYQALTRLAPPSASVVLLFGSRDAAFWDADHSESVDMDVVPAGDSVVRFLRRSVSISDKRVVFQLLEQSPPANWRRMALLRNHRAVFLNSAGVSDEIGSYRIVLDGETGARVVSTSEECL